MSRGLISTSVVSSAVGEGAGKCVVARGWKGESGYRCGCLSSGGYPFHLWREWRKWRSVVLELSEQEECEYWTE